MNKREVLKERMTALKNGATEKYSNKHFVEQRLMPDNTVRIDVMLPPETEIFDPLSPVGYGKLNPEIYAYIDEQAYFIPAEYDITVRFAGRTDHRQIRPRTLQPASVRQDRRYSPQPNVGNIPADIRRNSVGGVFLPYAVQQAGSFFGDSKHRGHVLRMGGGGLLADSGTRTQDGTEQRPANGACKSYFRRRQTRG